MLPQVGRRHRVEFPAPPPPPRALASCGRRCRSHGRTRVGCRDADIRLGAGCRFSSRGRAGGLGVHDWTESRGSGRRWGHNGLLLVSKRLRGLGGHLDRGRSGKARAPPAAPEAALWLRLAIASVFAALLPLTGVGRGRSILRRLSLRRAEVGCRHLIAAVVAAALAAAADSQRTATAGTRLIPAWCLLNVLDRGRRWWSDHGVGGALVGLKLLLLLPSLLLRRFHLGRRRRCQLCLGLRFTLQRLLVKTLLFLERFSLEPGLFLRQGCGRLRLFRRNSLRCGSFFFCSDACGLGGFLIRGHTCSLGGFLLGALLLGMTHSFFGGLLLGEQLGFACLLLGEPLSLLLLLRRELRCLLSLALLLQG